MNKEYINNLEKQIAKKYGQETIQNPRNNQNLSKDTNFLNQLKILQKREDDDNPINYKTELSGVLITNKLITKESSRTCPFCGQYSFNIEDDLYMIKYDCCFQCYIEYIEDREEQWEKRKQKLKIK